MVSLAGQRVAGSQEIEAEQPAVSSLVQKYVFEVMVLPQSATVQEVVVGTQIGEPKAEGLVPVTVAIPLKQVAFGQMLAAQPLSQFLVPAIQVKLFQQTPVVQVLAAQELSAQT